MVTWSKGSAVKLRIGLLAGLFAFVTLSGPTANAATTTTTQDVPSESILLSPTSKRYTLKAGTERADTLTVVNDGEASFDFVTYARPYSVNDEEYTADFMNNAKNADAYKWVQFSQPSYRVEPGKSVQVPYTVRVPAGASPGGHYGVLFAETLPSSQLNGTGVKSKKRVGAILYVAVEGNITRSGKLLRTDIPFFQFSAPLAASQRVESKGNTDIEVNTSIVVSDVFGTTKFKNNRQVVVLPGTVRKIESNWEKPAWLGLYKVELATSFLDTKSTTVKYVLIVPIWVYLLLGALILGRVLYAAKQHKKR